MVPGTFFYDLRKNGGKAQGLYKGSDSVTDDACTNSSVDMAHDDEESAWLDHWAQSITSIPLREPKSVSRKKKRGQPTKQSFVRPAHQHSTFLDCIAEADNESCASTVATESSTRTSRTTNSSKSKHQHKQQHHGSSARRNKGRFSTIQESHDPPMVSRRQNYDEFNVDVEVPQSTIRRSKDPLPFVSSMNVEERLSL
jgi:hypothetical protein